MKNSEAQRVPLCPMAMDIIEQAKAYSSDKEGRLTIVTGIRGHGKSTFIDNLCILLAYLYGFMTAAQGRS